MVHSVSSKAGSKEDINPLVSNYAHIERVLHLEDTPVLVGSEISLCLWLLKVVAGDNEEKIPPGACAELASPEEEVVCVIAEEEFSNHEESDEQELSWLQ